MCPRQPHLDAVLQHHPLLLRLQRAAAGPALHRPAPQVVQFQDLLHDITCRHGCVQLDHLQGARHLVQEGDAHA